MTTVGVARDAFEVFGTMAVLLVTDPRAIGEARRIADRELALVDRACSRFREDSELMLLNAAAGVGPQTISPVFTDLLAAALRAARLTGGDVDPTCGRALTDLGYDRGRSRAGAGSTWTAPRIASGSNAASSLTSAPPPRPGRRTAAPS
jgi:thiamine biosynthesis lipoprotein